MSLKRVKSIVGIIIVTLFALVTLTTCTVSGGSGSSDNGGGTPDTIVVIDPHPIISQPKPVQQKKSKRFYQDLLDDFCKKNFDTNSGGKTYVPGSIIVEDISTLDDDNVYEAIGTFSYKYRKYIIKREYTAREYRATIIEQSGNEYLITFQHLNESKGKWDSTGTLPYIYNLDE